ncbi:rac GTPase-activating protein 1-like isoform X1 [Leptopilina boulardi]|uniref:rac GTPase-activating protein 1-like isoform X1 n=1 Tax=Leptopilina boulardi TaxID=63433 RepID=UPI0021F65019|nr:rac GTPase-activating protein 1-like isoform X1 [Leptopilina boulardi]
MIFLKEFLLLFFVTFTLVQGRWPWKVKSHYGVESHEFGTIKNYTEGMDSQMVPYFVINCIEEVEKRGLKEEGLYFLSGKKNIIKNVLKSNKNKEKADLSKIENIHDITGALKLFIRSMEGRLINKKLWVKLLDTCGMDIGCREPELKNNILEFSKPIRQTLAFIIKHLQLVSQIPENKMFIESLALAFSRTLFSDIGMKKNVIRMLTPSRIFIIKRLLELPSEFWQAIISNDYDVVSPQ